MSIENKVAKDTSYEGLIIYRIDQLESRFSNLENKIDKLLDAWKSSEGDLKRITDKVERLTSDIINYKDNVDQLSQDLVKLDKAVTNELHSVKLTFKERLYPGAIAGTVVSLMAQLLDFLLKGQ